MFGARDAGAQAITPLRARHRQHQFRHHRRHAAQQRHQHLHAQRDQHQTLSGIPGRHHDPQRLPVLGRLAAAPPTRIGHAQRHDGHRARAPSPRTWTPASRPAYPFFGDFANVTSIVNADDGNGNYTFGGLTVNTGTPHCDVSACVGGWALIVIYESATERLRAINLYDGLDYVPRQPADAESRRLPRSDRQHRRPHRGVHARRRPGATRPR